MSAKIDATEIIVSVVPLPDGVMGLSNKGRLFHRVIDPKAYNTDGRNTIAHVWHEIKGPLE